MQYISIIIAGLLYTFSFSPIDFKLGIFISLIVFIYVLLNNDKRRHIKLSYLYGIVIFSTGTSWIYNSIYNYGGENIFLSIGITVTFILLLALFMIPIGIFLSGKNNKNSILMPLAFSSIWVLMEILRSNLFGGFPWLLVGTSQTLSIFDSMFPFLGTYSVSFIIAYISMSVFLFLNTQSKNSIKNLFIGLSFIMLISFMNISYTVPSEKLVNLTIVQPNINLSLKYDKNNIDHIKKKHLEIISYNKKNNIIIFPETSIPNLYNYDRRFYQGIINNSNIEIISGIFRKDASKEIYNSIVLLNKTEQFYDKRKLVPFGEYTPLNFFFNPIAEALNIPMSSLSHGLENQQNLILSNKIIVYPLICYESAYPGLLKIKDDRFGFILNLSNDGWFGKSFAPHQHLQIAQSRALETGYPVIRAANTGITAVINGNGVIEGRINLDEEGYLNMDIYPVKGITYYMYFGDYPILMLIFTIMLIYWKQLNRYE